MSFVDFPNPLSRRSFRLIPLLVEDVDDGPRQIEEVDDPGPTGLMGMPPELLQEIMTHLDNPSLLQLASTCKQLNTQSLHAFFERNDIRAPGDGWLVAYQTPPETLSAVRAALWVKHLKQVHFYFNFGIDILLGEVCDLYSLIKRLPSIELVKVHFSVVDSWILRNCIARVLDVNEWFRAFTALLDIIIEKGCTELHVTGGAQIKSLYSTTEAAELTVGDVERWIEESKRKPKRHVKGKAASVAHVVPVQEPNIVSPAFIRSTQGEVSRSAEMDKTHKKKFLQKLAALWTSNRFIIKVKRRKGQAVQAAMPDLPILKRRSEETMSLPLLEFEPDNASQRAKSSQPRTRPLTQISEAPRPITLDRDVSRLSNISIHSDMLLQPTFFPWTLSTLSNAPWRILNLSIRCTHIPTETWSALLRCMSLPNLENFEIATDLVVCSNGAAFKDLQYFFARHCTIQTLHLQGVERLDTPPVIEEPILPDLSSIMAHPLWIISLLEMKASHRGSLSHLKSIGISTEYYQFNHPFNYELFDAALMSVANLSAKDITLTLRFMCDQGVSSWFEEHVGFGTENSVLCRLTYVSHLVISGAFFVEMATYAKASLPSWLSLFPCLQTVTFVDIAEEQMKSLAEPVFLKSIAVQCPKIKTVGVREAVDLDDLRTMKYN